MEITEALRQGQTVLCKLSRVVLCHCVARRIDLVLYLDEAGLGALDRLEAQVPQLRQAGALNSDDMSIITASDPRYFFMPTGHSSKIGWYVSSWPGLPPLARGIAS